MYGAFTYFMTKIIIELPVLMLTPMINTLIIYFAMNLELTFSQFIKNWLIQFLCANAANAFGTLLSSIFESETAATAIAPVFVMPMMLFGGLFTNINESIEWLSWI